MICVFDRLATAFEGHGLGVLHPTKCEISEEAGGAYELTLEQPVTEAGEAMLLTCGAVIRAPGAPKREAGREQLFRISRVTRDENGESLTVQARHITYDLMYNSVGSVVHEEKAPAHQVAAEIMAALEDQAHGFTLIADGLSAKVAGSWELCNGVNALLDQEAGLVRMARARLIRDNHLIRLLPEGAPESGVVIRYGRNMTGLQMEEADEDVYTRLIPVGETAEGEDLYLPERQIDSPRISLYPRPRVMRWRVQGAKVGGKISGSDDKLSKEDVYDMLREAAQEKFSEFIDEPREELQAGYIDLGATEEYAAYAGLETVCLYDRVTIRHDPHGIGLQTEVSGYTWDVLAGRYTTLKLGDVYADKTANVIVTAPQLAQQRRETKRELIASNGRLDIVAREIYIQGEYIQLLATKEEVNGQGSRLSTVEIELDAAKAALLLKAERTELKAGMETIRSEVTILLDAANSKIDLKADREEMQEGMLAIRSEVGISLDALNTRIDLEATRRNELLGEINTAKISIDALKGEVGLKADQTITDALTKRVTSAEAALTVQAGQISTKVSAGDIASSINQTAQSVKIAASKIELSGYVTTSVMQSTLAAFMNNVTIDTASIDYATIRSTQINTLKVGNTTASWKSIDVVTGVTLSRTYNGESTYNFRDYDNARVTITVPRSVSSVTANVETATINYLGA